jgi:lysophospholipase L1-like esterase
MLPCVVASCIVACASGNPDPKRSDRGPAPSATEWTGARAEAPPPASPPEGENAGGWVLHVGDSFVHAFLWQNLRPRFLGMHTQYVVQATTATYTTTWAASPVLDEWLARRPSLVLVTLGANEVEMMVPEEHARAIEAITRKIAASGAACVWITPPMWKAESGILGVIHDHSAPCLFFDSDAVLGGLTPEERQHDRIHPNGRGGGRWARAFWDWLSDHRDPTRAPWALDPFERRG